MADKSSRITFEEFTQSTVSAIARTLEAHKLSENPLLRNPHIIIGIVWAPQLLPQIEGAAKKVQR